MQNQHHVHEQASPTVLWPRCSKVEIRNELIYCELTQDRQYDLVEAYRKTPHIQFMNCKSDDDLKSFTRAWGPLYLVLTHGSEDLRLGKAVRRLDECQAHRRWLRALKGLIEACRGRNDERGSLKEFLGAEADLDRTSNTYQPAKIPVFHTLLQHLFRYTGDSGAWAASTDIDSVRRALSLSVETYVRAPIGCLRVGGKRRKGFEINPTFSLPTLWDALQWMIWLDEWNGWPPPACLECHRIFPRLNAHERKYCSPECAHRTTNREWRRKDLLRRKQTPKTKADGGTRGPRKAR